MNIKQFIELTEKTGFASQVKYWAAQAAAAFGLIGETSVSNTRLGNLAGAGITTGTGNVMIGTGPGGSVTTGSNNLYIGDLAGGGDTGAGVSNVAIGATGGPVGDLTNTIAMGDAVYLSASNQWQVGALGTIQCVAEGTGGAMGAATLVAGTVTVSNANVTANSRIFLTPQNSSGTVGSVRVSARVVGTSFTILSSSGSDTSLVAWEIKEPN